MTKNNFYLLAPHQVVKEPTIAGWVKAILGSPGIDTNLFSAHSTRASSFSKPKVKGLSFEDISKRGDWSNKSTWQKHYYKFVSNESARFQKSIGLALRDKCPNTELFLVCIFLYSN